MPCAVKSTSGITLVELIIVVGILGVVLAIGIFNGRQALIQRQEDAALNTIRQVIWQGATAASSRGREVTLHLNNRTLQLRVGASVIRSDDLPAGVSTNLPQGLVLAFSPPGKVTAESLGDLIETSPRVWAGGRTYFIDVSVIGEVRVREGS